MLAYFFASLAEAILSEVIEVDELYGNGDWVVIDRYNPTFKFDFTRVTIQELHVSRTDQNEECEKYYIIFKVFDSTKDQTFSIGGFVHRIKFPVDSQIKSPAHIAHIKVQQERVRTQMLSWVWGPIKIPALPEDKRNLKIALTSQTWSECTREDGVPLKFNYANPTEQEYRTEVLQVYDYDYVFGKSDGLIIQSPQDGKCVEFQSVSSLLSDKAYYFYEGAHLIIPENKPQLFGQVYLLGDSQAHKQHNFTVPSRIILKDMSYYFVPERSHLSCAKARSVEGSRSEKCDLDGTYGYEPIYIGDKEEWTDDDWISQLQSTTKKCVQFFAKGVRENVTLYAPVWDRETNQSLVGKIDFPYQINISANIKGKNFPDNASYEMGDQERKRLSVYRYVSPIICMEHVVYLPVFLMGKEDKGLKKYCDGRGPINITSLDLQQNNGLTKTVNQICLPYDYFGGYLYTIALLIAGLAIFSSIHVCCRVHKAKETQATVVKWIVFATILTYLLAYLIPIKFDDQLTQSLLLLLPIIPTIFWSVVYIYQRPTIEDQEEEKQGEAAPFSIKIFLLKWLVFLLLLGFDFLTITLSFADVTELFDFLSLPFPSYNLERFNKVYTLIAQPYQKFIDRFQELLTENASLSAIAIAVFLFCTLNQHVIRGKSFEELAAKMERGAFDWRGLLCTLGFKLYGLVQNIVSMLVFQTVDSAMKYLNDNVYDPSKDALEPSENGDIQISIYSLIFYMIVTCLTLGCCYFFCFQKYNMVVPFYKALLKTVCKVAHNAFIALHSLTVAVFALFNLKTLRVALILFLTTVQHAAQIFLDFIALFLYPALLMGKEFETPMYFFIQIFGALPSEAEIKRMTQVTKCPEGTKCQVFGQILRSMMMQHLGMALLCGFLNTNVKVAIEAIAISNTFVMFLFTMWIPAVMLKDAFQQYLLDCLLSREEALPEGIVKHQAKYLIEQIRFNTTLQSDLEQIDAKYMVETPWLAGGRQDMMLSSYNYLPGLGRFAAVILPFFTSPSLMENGEFCGVVPFVLNCCSAITFLGSVGFAVFSDSENAHWILFACFVVLMALDEQDALGDFFSGAFSIQDWLQEKCVESYGFLVQKCKCGKKKSASEQAGLKNTKITDGELLDSGGDVTQYTAVKGEKELTQEQAEEGTLYW